MGDVTIETVASWNELEDRPFGEMVTEFVPEFACEFEDGYPYFNITPIPSFVIEDKKEYTVIWDGETYVCTADIDCFGSASCKFPQARPTDEPFYVSVKNNGEIEICAATSGAHTVAIHGKETRIIDPKFIPEKEVSVSWNDLQDKPFGWVCEPVTLTDFQGGNGMYAKIIMDESQAYSQLIPEKVYNVTWDGVQYQYKAIKSEIDMEDDEPTPVFVLGDIDLTNGTVTSPFAIMFMAERVAVYALNDGPHTFLIEGVALAKRYLSSAYYVKEIRRSVTKWTDDEYKEYFSLYKQGVKLYYNYEYGGYVEILSRAESTGIFLEISNYGNGMGHFCARYTSGEWSYIGFDELLNEHYQWNLIKNGNPTSNGFQQLWLHAIDESPYLRAQRSNENGTVTQWNKKFMVFNDYDGTLFYMKTPDKSKTFAITVRNDGTLLATEVTE